MMVFAGIMIGIFATLFVVAMLSGRRGVRFAEIIDDDPEKRNIRRFFIPCADEWIAAHHPNLPQPNDPHPEKRGWVVESMTVQADEAGYCEATVHYGVGVGRIIPPQGGSGTARPILRPDVLLVPTLPGTHSREPSPMCSDITIPTAFIADDTCPCCLESLRCSEVCPTCGANLTPALDAIEKHEELFVKSRS